MKTKFNKIAALVLAFALAVTLVPVNTEAAAKRKVALYVSQGTTLKAAKGAKWKTSSKKVATVSRKGKVTAKKAGKAVITAKKGKKSWKFTVTVKNPYLARKQTALLQGESETVKMVGASVKSCSSSNTGVAAVTRMKNAVIIRAVGAGGASVSVKASDGKTYSCGVAVNVESVDDAGKNATASSPTPCINSNCLRGDHVWDTENPVVKGTRYTPDEDNANYHLRYDILKCKNCDATTEKLNSRGQCDFVNEQREHNKDEEGYKFDPSRYTVVKQPTCTEDGVRYQFCSFCGRQQENTNWMSMNDANWEYTTTVPHLGHDFEYTYKREISVHPGWSTRNYPEASKNAVEGLFGERTATCKRCHKSFEEIGIDTGTELDDGTREIVWGVWRQDKDAEILKEINAYRTGKAGVTREPLLPSETLNRAAVYILAEKMQMWTTYGQTTGTIARIEGGMGRYRLRENVSSNFRETENCYYFGFPNEEYNIAEFTSCDLMNSAFRFNTDIKYAGVACFDIEGWNGDFNMGVIAVGKEDESLSYDCHHISAYEMALRSACYGEEGYMEDGTCYVPCLKCGYNAIVDPSLDDYY